MSNTKKLGGYASVLTGLLFVAILVIQFAVLAPQGEGPTATAEVSLGVATRLTSVYLIQDLFSVGFAITLVLGALAVCDRLAPGGPDRIRLSVIPPSVARAPVLAHRWSRVG